VISSNSGKDYAGTKKVVSLSSNAEIAKGREEIVNITNAFTNDDRSAKVSEKIISVCLSKGSTRNVKSKFRYDRHKASEGDGRLL
jgi:hypothetical protein